MGLWDADERRQTQTDSDDPIGVQSFCRHRCRKQAVNAPHVLCQRSGLDTRGRSQPVCGKDDQREALAPPVRQKLWQRSSASPCAVPMADFAFMNNPG